MREFEFKESTKSFHDFFLDDYANFPDLLRDFLNYSSRCRWSGYPAGNRRRCRNVFLLVRIAFSNVGFHHIAALGNSFPFVRGITVSAAARMAFIIFIISSVTFHFSYISKFARFLFLSIFLLLSTFDMNNNRKMVAIAIMI